MQLTRLGPAHVISPRTDIDFLTVIGGNTFYVSHPEEIIAGKEEWVKSD